MEQLEEVRAHLYVEEDERHSTTQWEGGSKESNVLWEEREKLFRYILADIQNHWHLVCIQKMTCTHTDRHTHS